MSYRARPMCSTVRRRDYEMYRAANTRLLRCRVLISPMAVSSTGWDEQKILLSASRNPSRGVSRQAIATALMNGPGV